ncbi:hypothetical protein [Treponema putidum]|uniref:Lipoprotein n=1 Tax=Treponema putidum TaxID=221027 RepID=A0AAE9SKV5_9SPIR|nr:hypothetical protein [Treponema putidum]UTY30623.1 hypothetical protein E4N75_02980 [Treponema putidum]UTY33034.1 hypothetical protein E4N74_02675 [Treponema putidum]
MKKNIKKEYPKSLILFILIILFSCSFENPEMPELSVKIIKIETDADTIEERLSVFLKYRDENGRNDYSSIRIIHLESGFTWVLNRENTSFFSSSRLGSSDSEKILWAGSNKIGAPLCQIPVGVPRGRILTGEYSIIVEDLAGNRTIKKITIKESELISSRPFVFEIQDKKWKIEVDEVSQFKNFSLILSGADKQPLFVQVLPSALKYDESLSPLLEKYPDARYIQCMAKNLKGDIAYLTKYHSLY